MSNKIGSSSGNSYNKLIRNMQQVGGQTSLKSSKDLKKDAGLKKDEFTPSSTTQKGMQNGITSGLAGRMGSEVSRKKDEEKNPDEIKTKENKLPSELENSNLSSIKDEKSNPLNILGKVDSSGNQLETSNTNPQAIFQEFPKKSEDSSSQFSGVEKQKPLESTNENQQTSETKEAQPQSRVEQPDGYPQVGSLEFEQAKKDCLYAGTDLARRLAQASDEEKQALAYCAADLIGIDPSGSKDIRKAERELKFAQSILNNPTLRANPGIAGAAKNFIKASSSLISEKGKEKNKLSIFEKYKEKQIGELDDANAKFSKVSETLGPQDKQKLRDLWDYAQKKAQKESEIKGYDVDPQGIYLDLILNDSHLSLNDDLRGATRNVKDSYDRLNETVDNIGKVNDELTWSSNAFSAFDISGPKPELETKQTELATWYQAIAKDRQNAQQIYATMAADRRKWIMEMWKLCSDTQNKVFELIQTANISKAKTMDKLMQQWNAVIAS